MMQEWFTDAKLGIFIHWGIYAVQQRGGESWPIARGQVSYDEYMTQFDGFTAKQYDPDAWADLVVRSGARYAVLTTKHHDGVALWPTKEDGPSIPAKTGLPDLVKGFVDAVRARDLRVGLYYSHTDWSDMNHMEVLIGKTHAEQQELRKVPTPFMDLILADLSAMDMENKKEYWDTWQKFLDFHKAQLTEILTGYGPIDLVWFDVMMQRGNFGYKPKELREYIHSICDTTVINSRMAGHGDYETPEQFIPVKPSDGPWELAVTTNDTWSYTGREQDYKTPFELITMFCECLGMGGNMLLNVGPDPDGVIPSQQVALLETIGRWIKKHEEAVYGTARGLPHGFAYHSTAFNKARDVMYVYVAHMPAGGDTSIKGIKNDIKKITVLGDGAECTSKRIGGAPWLGVPGTLWIDIPEGVRDEFVTVLKVELDGVLDLHGGEGVEININ